jgi:hypothetical protein
MVAVMIKFSIVNLMLLVDRSLARHLRKKGWVVFYLDEEFRVCREGHCWLKLYRNEEKRKTGEDV